MVIQDLSVEAEVGLVPAETGFALVVSLSAIFYDMEYEICNELVQLTHLVCPYSNALRNNVDVKISVKMVSSYQKREIKMTPFAPQYAHVYFDQWGGGGGDPKEH